MSLKDEVSLKDKLDELKRIVKSKVRMSLEEEQISIQLDDEFGTKKKNLDGRRWSIKKTADYGKNQLIKRPNETQQ